MEKSVNMLDPAWINIACVVLGAVLGVVTWRGADSFFVQPTAYNSSNASRELLSRQYFKETNQYLNTVQIVVTTKMSAGDYLPFTITRSTGNNFRIASGHTKLTIIPVRID